MKRPPIVGCEILGRDQMQEPVAEVSQIFPAAEVVKDLYPRGVPDPVQPAHCIAFLCAHPFLKKENPGHEILQFPGRVKEPGFPGNYDLWDSRDRGCEHDS